MNNCPKCNITYDDEKKYCKVCGNKLVPEAKTMANATKVLYWSGSLVLCFGLLALLVPIYLNVNYLSIKISNFIIHLIDRGSDVVYLDQFAAHFGNSYLQTSIILYVLLIIIGLVLIMFSNRSDDLMSVNGLYFRSVIVALAIIGSFKVATQLENWAGPTGQPIIVSSGWGFRISYSLIYGLAFFIVLIIIPKIYSYFQNQNSKKF